MEKNNIKENKKSIKSNTNTKPVKSPKNEENIKNSKDVAANSKAKENKTKKKRCSYIWIYVFIVIVAVVIASSVIFGAKKYKMNFDNMDSVLTIEVSNNVENTSLTISSSQMVKDIVLFIKKVNYTTKIASVSDEPNVDIYHKITLKTKDASSVVYIYEKDGKKYIEQPYNGIYEVSDEVYDLIYDYIVV